MRKRAAYQKRMVVENMREGRKIFVDDSAEGQNDVDAVRSLWRALRKLGANWLFWVRPGADVGNVRMTRLGLLRGTIDRLKRPGDTVDLSFDGWLAVVTRAYMVVRDNTRGPGS